MTEKIALKQVPIVVYAAEEASELREYASKFESIDVAKILLKLKSKAEKEKFKYRILDFKIAYNKCADIVIELESFKTKDKLKKKRELKELLAELDAIWKYLIVNYKL
ncbi:MAG: hypothetical protein Q7U04_05480 [Bacteriovorax sp.]|nr:hypothetical protein [Bacteriovorax sp.]